jgi:hypothetical protein
MTQIEYLDRKVHRIESTVFVLLVGLLVYVLSDLFEFRTPLLIRFVLGGVGLSLMVIALTQRLPCRKDAGFTPR